jgi:hypothetical protein
MNSTFSLFVFLACLISSQLADDNWLNLELIANLMINAIKFSALVPVNTELLISRLLNVCNLAVTATYIEEVVLSFRFLLNLSITFW